MRQAITDLEHCAVRFQISKNSQLCSGNSKAQGELIKRRGKELVVPHTASLEEGSYVLTRGRTENKCDEFSTVTKLFWSCFQFFEAGASATLQSAWRNQDICVTGRPGCATSLPCATKSHPGRGFFLSSNSTEAQEYSTNSPRVGSASWTPISLVPGIHQLQTMSQ